MKIEGERESTNVIDARGRSGGRGIPLTFSSVVVVLFVSYLTGQNPLTLLALLTSQSPSSSVQQTDSRGSYQATPEEESSRRLLSVVLGSTEEVWKQTFEQMGKTYREPKLVVFTDQVQSACGYSSNATGPFYCPGDERLYIDLGFLAQLQRTLGAEGDFAAAYVVAHEVGHHVQTLLGLNGRVSSPANQVEIELQADCLAGVWGHFASQRGLLETGDIEEGINAAKSVGDDRIQSMQGRSINPESFTHGSSRERAKWFSTGLENGDMRACDVSRARG